jgi:hypothetical protein
MVNIDDDDVSSYEYSVDSDPYSYPYSIEKGNLKSNLLLLWGKVISSTWLISCIVILSKCEEGFGYTFVSTSGSKEYRKEVWDVSWQLEKRAGIGSV